MTNWDLLLKLPLTRCKTLLFLGLLIISSVKADPLYPGDVWLDLTVGTMEKGSQSEPLQGLTANYLFSPNFHARSNILFTDESSNKTRLASLDLLQHFSFSDYWKPYIGAGVMRGIKDVDRDLYLSTFVGNKFLFTKRVWLSTEYGRSFIEGEGDDLKITRVALGTRFGRIRNENVYDSDGDGVIDPKDECPDTPPGTPVDDVGCPTDGDQDRDGVPDSRDRCPNTPFGVPVDQFGCEIVAKPKDADQDGVVDSKDYCPDTPLNASVDNYGCEAYEGVIQRAVLKGVNFNVNSSFLKRAAIVELQLMAHLLQRTPFTHIEVNGHTDSKGKSSYNRWLSTRRAERTKDVLVSAGLPGEKIQTHGFGETQPIASNKTAKGRAMNRRVVMTIWDLNKITKRRCPSTPLPQGLTVHNGCTPMQNAAIVDPDGDGVENGRDRCPDTRKGAIVDGRGCELKVAGNQIDRDQDGIPDNFDYCRKTPIGSAVDHLGCPLEKDLIERVLLDDVTFEYNSTNLSLKAIERLDQLVARLRTQPFSKIIIEGHTDNRDNHEYNNWLSTARAKTIRNYITLEGISAANIEVIGHGERQPVANNRSKRGRAKNRRVMISIWK